MKSLLIIITIVSLGLKGSSQIEDINRLVSKIDNSGLCSMCNFVMMLKCCSKEADSLIILGKEIDMRQKKSPYRQMIIEKLIPLLKDTTKGIIAHYVLSNIWTNFNEISSGYDGNRQATKYIYNGLEFYVRPNDSMYADQIKLNDNLQRWRLLLSK